MVSPVSDYDCAPPHSGQNFADFGIGLPQFMQNFVSADVPAGAIGPAGPGGVLGAPGSGGRIAFIMV
jgi:hypothetical protein